MIEATSAPTTCDRRCLEGTPQCQCEATQRSSRRRGRRRARGKDSCHLSGTRLERERCVAEPCGGQGSAQRPREAWLSFGASACVWVPVESVVSIRFSYHFLSRLFICAICRILLAPDPTGELPSGLKRCFRRPPVVIKKYGADTVTPFDINFLENFQEI